MLVFAHGRGQQILTTNDCVNVAVTETWLLLEVQLYIAIPTLADLANAVFTLSGRIMVWVHEKKSMFTLVPCEKPI